MRFRPFEMDVSLNGARLKMVNLLNKSFPG